MFISYFDFSAQFPLFSLSLGCFRFKQSEFHPTPYSYILAGLRKPCTAGAVVEVCIWLGNGWVWLVNGWHGTAAWYAPFYTPN